MPVISDVYKKYKILGKLGSHMLTVAAVANLICDSFNLPIDKKKVITVCLLHDMGNVVKFDFNNFAKEFFEPEGIEYWQSVQKEFIKKYGSSDHHATIQIITELGLDPDIVKLSKQSKFTLLCKHLKEDNIILKIIHYADMRVSPSGVLSYEDRMEEARQRYSQRFGSSKYSEKERDILTLCGKNIEYQIFMHCSIKPNDINNVSVIPVVESLRSFMI